MSSTLINSSIDDTPAVRAALAARAPIAARQRELADRQRRYSAILSPYADRERAVDALDLLDAQANGARVRIELAAVERDLLIADQAVVAARRAERDKLRTALDPHLKDAVKKLAKALDAVRPLNDAVQALEQDLHDRAGAPIEGWSWVQLARSNGTTFESKLDDWLRRVDERFGG